jgi:hypothetical protein
MRLLHPLRSFAMTVTSRHFHGETVLGPFISPTTNDSFFCVFGAVRDSFPPDFSGDSEGIRDDPTNEEATRNFPEDWKDENHHADVAFAETELLYLFGGVIGPFE